MREKLIYILIFSFLFISCDFTSADEYYNRAIELDKQGKYNEAIISLDKAIDKKSKFRPALLNRGFYKSKLEKFEEGIKDYNKILEFDNDNTFALFNIGNNYSSLNDSKNAIAYYSKALQTEGALKSFASSDGGAFALNTNFDLKSFDSDRDYSMLDCEIYFERGMEYLEIEQFDKAISDFNKSIKANNAKRDCYFLLGKAFIGKKDSINACENFIKSAKLGDKEAREMLKKHCIKKE
ncbi:tetratricopeptide repeat protein [Mariniflexile jejuense]|uniref:Tetratricopeptide repeat protein n=1 Tax=Mariniflexile jejuense TaxID=1173582 RepID=A0ABW3JEA6_9FLAO